MVDIADEKTFSSLPDSDVDCVIDFADCLPAMMKAEDRNTFYSVSIVKATINVLDYMRKVGCKKIIFPQSVYDTYYLFGTRIPIPADAD